MHSRTVRTLSGLRLSEQPIHRALGAWPLAFCANKEAWAGSDAQRSLLSSIDCRDQSPRALLATRLQEVVAFLYGILGAGRHVGGLRRTECARRQCERPASGALRQCKRPGTEGTGRRERDGRYRVGVDERLCVGERGESLGALGDAWTGRETEEGLAVISRR